MLIAEVNFKVKRLYEVLVYIFSAKGVLAWIG
jgi:hypothetical protein